MAKHPTRNAIYTLRELLTLDLPDSPHLGFWHDGINTVVQNAHLTEEQLLAVPDLADTRWRYIRTTREWIPVFMCESTEALMACVDIEPELNPLPRNQPGWWVTPKGHERLQYGAQPKCPYCGVRMENPCESAPVDTCEQALAATHGAQHAQTAHPAR